MSLRIEDKVELLLRLDQDASVKLLCDENAIFGMVLENTENPKSQAFQIRDRIPHVITKDVTRNTPI